MGGGARLEIEIASGVQGSPGTPSRPPVVGKNSSAKSSSTSTVITPAPLNGICSTERQGSGGGPR